MKVIVTGSHGTVGLALGAYLKTQGHEVVGWDRSRVPINDYWSMEKFLKDERPQVLYHLATPSRPTGIDNEGWMVNYQWTSELAWLCKVLEIDFIFTSTVMVFSNEAKGPFTIDSRADASEGYGMEKRMAEERVFYQNPEAKVVRLGWQIGTVSGSNNMIDFIENKMKTDGLVPCSTQWFPACSFLDDTVAILKHMMDVTPGLYLFDGNERWSFYQIVFALNLLHGKKWKVTANDSFIFDQRMLDDRLPKFSIQKRLKGLK